MATCFARFLCRRRWSGALGAFLLLGGTIGCGQEPKSGRPVAAPPTQAKATVYGAAGQVSGSLTLLDTGTHRCLVDCGAFYANAEETVPAVGDAAFAFQPRDIHAVFCYPSDYGSVAIVPAWPKALVYGDEKFRIVPRDDAAYNGT